MSSSLKSVVYVIYFLVCLVAISILFFLNQMTFAASGILLLLLGASLAIFPTPGKKTNDSLTLSGTTNSSSKLCKDQERQLESTVHEIEPGLYEYVYKLIANRGGAEITQSPTTTLGYNICRIGIEVAESTTEVPWLEGTTNNYNLQNLKIPRTKVIGDHFTLRMCVFSGSEVRIITNIKPKFGAVFFQGRNKNETVWANLLVPKE